MRRAPSSRSFGSGLSVGDTRPERAWRRARRERARSRSLASGGETVASRFVDCRGLNANAASGHTPRREGRHEDPTAEEADRHGVSRDPRPESAKSRSRDVFEPASPARDPQRALTQISSLSSPPLLDQPGSVKLMVEKMVATPALQLADVFPPFAWTFGKVRSRRASAATPTATSAAEAHATPRRFSRFSCAQRTVSAHRASAPFSRLHDPCCSSPAPSPPLEDFSKKSFSSRRARRIARGRTLTSPPPSTRSPRPLSSPLFVVLA